MNLRIGYKPGFCLAALILLLFCAVSMQSQQRADKIGVETTTEERLNSAGWWPTKPGTDANAYVGSAECSRCHAEETAHTSTPMQRAAMRAKDAAVMNSALPLSLSSAPFQYALASGNAGIEYSVSKETQKLSRPLEWIMGAGELGQTFLYEIDDHWYESQLSYYVHAPKLDTTPGHSDDSTADLTAALGQRLSGEDAQRCFGCHTTRSMTTEGFSPLLAVPGLGCEACHGPGREHVDMMGKAKSSAGNGGQTDGAAIFNPAKLSPVDSVDFCGSCHRTWADVAFSKGTGTTIVRFQPYRLELSKCWGKNGDERLTCVACHDPHEPLDRDLGSYDRKCLQCHTKGASEHPSSRVAKVCPKATQQCVTCHMPKVEVANMHGEFTDHDIRIARAGEAFPR
jgi:Cytochrome c3